jgi:hypothetical protein
MSLGSSSGKSMVDPITYVPPNGRGRFVTSRVQRGLSPPSRSDGLVVAAVMNKGSPSC